MIGKLHIQQDFYLPLTIREYASPYQKKVAKHFQIHEGGKKGDIEVIVCQVKLQ